MLSALGGEGSRRGWLLAAALSLLAAPWLGRPAVGGLYSLLLGTQDRALLGPLSRANEIVELERALDGVPLKGACYLGEPLLPHLPQQACRPAACIWSKRARRKVPLVASTSSGAPVEAAVAAAAAAKASVDCLQPTGGQLAAQQGQQPQVSLVFVDRNNSLTAGYSLLELFLNAAEAPSVEFIVVSLGAAASRSGGGGAARRPAIQVAERLQHLFGVQVTFLEAPDLGSAHTLGIEAAHGQFVALVDSHMLVLRGWLGAALATLTTSPRAAAVAPLTLSSAAAAHHVGGLIDASGLATLHGKGQRLSADMYFRRELDFAPLDCLVVKRQALKEVWGVDDHFRTNRYKAADLGLALRSAGFQVLLQPLALVLAAPVQEQGAGESGAGSAGTAGLEALAPGDEQHDRERLRDKWGMVLQLKHCPPGTDAFTAANRHVRPRLLWVDDTPPQPDKDSGSIRSLNMLQVLLEEGYHVSMLTTHAATHARYPAQVRALGLRLLPKMDPSQWPLARNGRCDFDVILVARRDVYLAAEAVLSKHCPGVPKVYDTVDLHFLREARDVLTAAPEGSKQGTQRGWEVVANLTTSRIADWLDAGAAQAAEPRKARDVELRLVDASALTVVVSYEEVDLIWRYRPQAQLAVVSNVHLVEGPPRTSCHGRSGLLFVGNMNHLPNRQALETHVVDVLPRVLRLLPWRERWRLRLHVVASGTVPKQLLSLLSQHSSQVVFHGYLPDDELYALYNTSMVAVAPLLSGAGVKGKVNQAMKLGVPVVATPIAIEGTGAQDGRECLVASDPEGFAAKVAQVYTDCALWGRLAEAGYRNVQRHFSREMGGPALLQALNQIGVGPLHDFHRDMCQSQGRLPGSSNRS